MKMKMIVGVICIFSLICLYGCGFKETRYSGINATIENVDIANQIIYVKDIEEGNSSNGKECSVDCTDANLIYVDFDTGDLSDITLTDLKKGDEITMDLSQIEHAKISTGYIKANQIQLQTQR